MTTGNNDNGMLLLATIIKKLALVLLVLGLIGSYFIGKTMGEIKYLLNTYTRYISYDFSSFLIGAIIIIITSLLIYVLGEILERVVFCDANILTFYNAMIEKKEEETHVD